MKDASIYHNPLNEWEGDEHYDSADTIYFDEAEVQRMHGKQTQSMTETPNTLYTRGQYGGPAKGEPSGVKSNGKK